MIAENEETEGSEGQAEYMFGDAELDDDDLYSMEHENQTGKNHVNFLEATGEWHSPALMYSWN